MDSIRTGGKKKQSENETNAKCVGAYLIALSSVVTVWRTRINIAILQPYTANNNSMGHPMVFTRAEVDAPPQHQCTVGQQQRTARDDGMGCLRLGCLEINKRGCK